MLSAAVMSLTACETAEFGSLNENPNEPTSASPSILLSNVEGAVSNYLGTTTPNLYVQYLSNGQYDEESRYQTLNWSYEYWYTTLTDLKRIIALNTNEETKDEVSASDASNANQIAVATILRVYIFQGMTNRWGRLPYTQALGGLDNQFPAYDSQEEIYNGLFSELDSALGMIESGIGPNGDYLFGGDMARWEQFGQTLKMVMALRLSEADPTLGKTKFNEALGNVITSNSENFFYPYLEDENNDNPWEDRFYAPSFRRDYLVSDVFVNALIGSGSSATPEDPRLAEMAEPALNSGTFVGAPYGQSNSDTDSYSFITQNVINNTKAPLYMFTYAEILFARAEAAALGWTSEDASSLYEDAITASMDQWGVSDSDATAYIAANPYVGLESIGYEKWVALYLQGYDSWAEWRRMLAAGYEKELTAPQDLLSNATDIPDRDGYPATAGAVNEQNYNDALEAQGPDLLNTKLWIFK